MHVRTANKLIRLRPGQSRVPGARVYLNSRDDEIVCANCQADLTTSAVWQADRLVKCDDCGSGLSVRGVEKPHWSNALGLLNVCDDAARKWALTQPDFATAWEQCRHAGWMLWLAAQTKGNDLRVVARIACDCQERLWPYLGPRPDETAWPIEKSRNDTEFRWRGEPRTARLFAVHLTRQWAAGRVDLKTMRAAVEADWTSISVGAWRRPLAAAASAEYIAQEDWMSAWFLLLGSDLDWAAFRGTDNRYSTTWQGTMKIQQADMVRAQLSRPVLM